MSRLQAPQFLVDVFRDLRDRRLLVPVAALLVALVAVPVALSSGGDEVVAPPAATPVDADDATQVQSAVLAEQGGIRNYRERLEELKSKNPFKQQFTSVPGSKDETADVASDAVSSAIDALSGASSSAGATTSGSSGGSHDGLDPVDPITTQPNEPASDPAPLKPEIRFFAGRVDVTVGPLEHTKKLEGVRALDMLPSRGTPVVAFLGLGESADKAVFVVSSDVVMTDGDGNCAGGGGDGTCQFVELQPGDQRFFHLGDGSIHRLRVLDTDVVRVPDPRDRK
jgi:hypothetical protein